MGLAAGADGNGRDRSVFIWRGYIGPLQVRRYGARCYTPKEQTGGVEEWRHTRRSGLSVAPRFLWECLTNRTVAGFDPPPRRTERADSLRKKIYRT